MTICNKIQTLGETMETNLNARGVSCTFGTGTGESTVLDMVEMVNGTNFKGSSDVNLKIGANRPYLLENETTDVVVKLENGLCEPLKNKNVIVGESIFIDNGTTASHNDSWNVSNGTMTRMDSYTRLVESAQTLMCQMNSGYITPTSTVEFDFKAVDGVKNWGLVYIRNGAGGTSLADLSLNNVGGEIGEWIHLKIVFNNTNTITIYSSKLDNPITKTLSSTSTNYRLLLYCGGVNTELHFKNVTVYETINGVTDGKGEFALYDVSVTDDTTFTATYGTETATCLVEYCQFVDYGVTNNNDDNWSTWSTYTVSRTRTDSYTLIEPVDRTTASYQIKYINNMSSPRIIEFDCCQVGGATNSIIFQLRGNNQSVIRQLALSSYTNLSLGEWYHWKVDLVNGKFTNETTNQTLTFNTGSIISFFFCIQANAQHNLKYKNFIIY